MKKKAGWILALMMFVLIGCTSKNVGYAIAESMNTDDLRTILNDSSITPNVGILDTESLQDVYEELAFEIDSFNRELQLMESEDFDELEGELLQDVFATLAIYAQTIVDLMDEDTAFNAYYLGDDRDVESIYGISVLVFSKPINIDSELVEFMNELANEEIGEAVYVNDKILVIAESDYISDIDQFLKLAEQAVTKHVKAS
ncbi:hypothetical protein [Erysipelothrix aquatica]|uniref:hypothetical protein n=1 Tax=Erysipelothrix aquatica TaxID=2683714 RepID=UPI0013586BDA|nr:hypothetical protein [Erysipelothrix aquatica]